MDTIIPTNTITTVGASATVTYNTFHDSGIHKNIFDEGGCLNLT
jgi:hypothetical protein